MTKKIFSLIFLLFCSFSFSQDTSKIIDSLKQVISTKPSDSIKIKVYGDLSWYYGRVSNDSAFHYGNLALELSKKTNDLVGEAQAYNDLGIIHYRLGEFNQSNALYHKSLNIRKQLNDSLGLASLYNKLGISFQRTFEMDSAIFYGTKALEIYRDKGNIAYVAIIKNNIANIYNDLKQYEKALETHLEVEKIRLQMNDSKQLTYSYNNIGNTYLSLKDTLQSVSYYKKGIELAEANNYEPELATLYNNYGTILMHQGKTNEALNTLNKALFLREKIGDKYGIVSTALNIGRLNLMKREFKQANNNFHLALTNAKQTDAKEQEMVAYSSLLDYSQHIRNIDSVTYYLELYNVLKDTIYSERVTKEVAEIQEKYDTAEREKEIETQRADIAEKELNLNQKNTQLIGLVILAVILSLLGYLLYNQQKLKNRQLQKESELKEALVKIETQNKLQEQRLRISRDLHDNIGAQLTFIISSLDNLKYGFKIPKKLDEKLSSIGSFTSSTIYELRDTIWAMNKSEITFEDLQTRISNFIDKADLASHNTKFNFKVEKGINRTFTSVEGMNIYRIIQEAVNNAIKYAEAKNINVEIKEAKDKLNLAIKDDGKGFDLKSVENGNGLNNIKKRAQDIDAKCTILSKVDKGTTVKITI